MAKFCKMCGTELHGGENRCPFCHIPIQNKETLNQGDPSGQSLRPKRPTRNPELKDVAREDFYTQGNEQSSQKQSQPKHPQQTQQPAPHQYPHHQQQYPPYHTPQYQYYPYYSYGYRIYPLGNQNKI